MRILSLNKVTIAFTTIGLMMTKFHFFTAIFFLFIFLPMPVCSQSYDDAVRVRKEANEIREKAQTHEDLRRAEQKYFQAIKIYEQIGERKDLPFAYRGLANIHIALGRYDKAEESCRKSLQESKELGDLRGEGFALNLLGMIYKYKNLYDEAAEYLEKSLTLAIQIHDFQLQAFASHNLGMVYHNWGKRDKALEWYVKSLKLLSEVKDPHCEANCLNNIGNLYREWGQYDKAKEYFTESLILFTNLKDRTGEATTLNNLGLVYIDWGKYDKAAYYLEQAFTMAQELRNPRLGSSGLHNLGLVYSRRGNYSKALEYYLKAVQLNVELNDGLGQGSSLNNVGNVYRYWGYYDKAVEYYQRSLDVSRAFKNPNLEATSLANLGLVHSSWGQYITAAEFYQKALEIEREQKNRLGQALALSNIGSILQYKGDYVKALEYYHKELDLLTELKVSTERPKALIADAYMDMGNFDKAEPLLKEVNLYALWGRYYLLKHDFSAAKDYYSKLLKSAEENKNVDNLFTAFTGIGRALEESHNYSDALDNYRMAVKLSEEIRSYLSFRERERFFDVRINGFLRTAPYEGLARTLLRIGEREEAFQASEYTKARFFAEVMTRRSHATAFSISPEIQSQDQSINNELASLKTNLQKAIEKNDQLLINSLQPQVRDLEGEFEKHVKMLRANYPLFAATKYPLPIDISNTALKDQECLLSYDVTETGVLIYLIQGKRVIQALFNPFPRKKLEDLVRKFREPLEVESGSPLLDQIKHFDFTSGKMLSDLLLRDILPLLPEGEPVIIVPSGVLGIIPFEMLILNTDNLIATDKSIPYIAGTDFFGDRNPISYYQSITALTLARTLAPNRTRGKKQLLMVDPVFDVNDIRCKQFTKGKETANFVPTADRLLSAIKKESIGQVTFPRLELTRALGDSLRNLDPSETDEYRDFTASKFVLFEKPMEEYKFLIFATHGYFGTDLPGIMEPVLVLTLVNQPNGKDGYLRLSEVMGLKLNAEIVALTACQTGLGHHVSGEGTMGMGRAFQYAGANSVLATLWSISEMTSVNFAKIFFERIKTGESRLKALKIARDAIRKAGYDHPFFWAPFVLVGETN
jgi:tetratricopeptide (TPR) repeat protein